ncbi:MAG: adenylate kinase family protein [Candidatus Thermoplasmatota archaeon]|nr:AAA family ATPase [Euryarchaeota archaeon]MBU4032371.1 adenylate kinase family protein [Candidatus Thermoplasmatota archaeon]MBU4070800.1 adenylate kinase family protein [Candidatus Thermoplasmatota archaeon]MBU4144796.1 adenylate kinase family protein [Candidatus Thermoplasmatota archaeon]MBU4591634.1 adenylate kinase family protein [Candidatus Thermoplasmatota archaeon]
MYIALSGTPGTGKSSAAKILASRGYTVVTVEELARKHGAIEEVGGDLEVDTEALSNVLEQPTGTIIIEGHLSHCLPNGLCVILRCHPEELRKRLSGRKYSREKVLDNLEAEAIDIILSEAVEACETVCEIDTSSLSVEAIADAIESIINDKADEYPPGKIDWSGAVMDWY